MGAHVLLSSFISTTPLPVNSSPQRLKDAGNTSPLRRARFRAQAAMQAGGSAIGRRAVVLAGGSLLAGLTTGNSLGILAPAAAADELVSDSGRLLGRGVRARLETELRAVEVESGVRVRVVTRGATVASDDVLRGQVALDDARKVVILADSRGGNLLTVRVGDEVYKTLPRSFWIELPNRFGNQFYVSDVGVDAAISAAVGAIRACVQPGRKCSAVPGVSDDQLKISVACSAAAGVIAGAAARTGGKRFNVPFLLLYSPIWSIFLISFGLGPVLARLQGIAHMETALVASAFAIVAGAIWWWIPRGIGPPPDASDNI